MDKTTILFKALSDKNRLRVVFALTHYNELCACQLTEFLQVTGATVSRHLGVLLSAGLVDSRKDGRWVNYRLLKDDPELKHLLGWIKERLNGDPDADADHARLMEITGLDREDLCRKQRGEACCPIE